MNKELLKLLGINLVLTSEYSQLEYDGLSMDPLVNDCLMHLYISLLMNDGDSKKDEYFDTSVKIYRSLDEERKKYIRNEIVKMLNAQDENQKQYKKER